MKNKNTSILIGISLLLSCLSTSLNAQCELSTAQENLVVDNVSTTLQVTGDLWWDGNEGDYLFPKPPLNSPEEGVSAMKLGGIWVGGIDSDSNIRIAAQTNGRSEGLTDYWPGPSDDPDDCANYDRFWTVTDEDIAIYLADYFDNFEIDGPIPPAILAWPGNQNPYSLEMNGFEIPFSILTNETAPFIDVNSDNIYNPDDGDYPDIKCSSYAVWWQYNDIAGTHTQTGGAPIGLNTSVLAYTYDSENIYIQNTTFYELRFRKINPEPVLDAYIGLWIDFDLGCPFDDMVGCDTTNQLAYVYNQDAVDGITSCSDCNGYNTYCESIPMLGAKMFAKPLAPRLFINGIDGSDGLRPPGFGEIADTIVQLDMSKFNYYNNDLPNPTNGNPLDFYNVLSGKFADGTPLTKGGTGYNPGSTEFTNFAFPSSPDDPNGWSMCNENINGGDQKMLISYGPLSFTGGAKNIISFAIVGAENIVHPCPSLETLLATADDALLYAEEAFLSSLDGRCSSFFPTSIETPEANSTEVIFQPNPMDQQGVFILKDSQELIKELELYSSTGQRVSFSKTIDGQTAKITKSNLSEGIYFYVLKTNESKVYTGKIVVL